MGIIMEMILKNSGDKLYINCPDEDADFTLAITDKGRKSKAVYVLSIEEAEKLKTFLAHHIRTWKAAENTNL